MGGGARLQKAVNCGGFSAEIAGTGVCWCPLMEGVPLKEVTNVGFQRRNHWDRGLLECAYVRCPHEEDRLCSIKTEF